MTITPTIAVHVLAHFGEPGGIPAGSFTRKLIDLIGHADPTNRARIALGFPGYVKAVDIAQNRDDGITELQAIAATTFGTVTWERCTGCSREYRYPHLCREHMLCGLCHPPVGSEAEGPR